MRPARPHQPSSDLPTAEGCNDSESEPDSQQMAQEEERST
jgi:hypothetical protein